MFYKLSLYYIVTTRPVGKRSCRIAGKILIMAFQGIQRQIVTNTDVQETFVVCKYIVLIQNENLSLFDLFTSFVLYKSTVPQGYFYVIFCLFDEILRDSTFSFCLDASLIMQTPQRGYQYRIILSIFGVSIFIGSWMTVLRLPFCWPEQGTLANLTNMVQQSIHSDVLEFVIHKFLQRYVVHFAFCLS